MSLVVKSLVVFIYLELKHIAKIKTKTYCKPWLWTWTSFRVDPVYSRFKMWESIIIVLMICSWQILYYKLCTNNFLKKIVWQMCIYVFFFIKNLGLAENENDVLFFFYKQIKLSIIISYFFKFFTISIIIFYFSAFLSLFFLCLFSILFS